MFSRGQSSLEYVIIICVVLAALLAMQFYINRGLQGKFRSSTDSIGDQYSAGMTISTYRTQQKTGTAMITKEKFGTADIGEGVSRSEVEQAAEIERSASGEEAEKIDTKLQDESLFWTGGE